MIEISVCTALYLSMCKAPLVGRTVQKCS